MAKLTGKAKAAFLRRMALGRAKASRKSGITAKRRRRSRRSTTGVVSMRIKRRRNPGMAALIANPSYVMYGPSGRTVIPVRRAKGKNMAKRRKRSSGKRRRTRRTTRPVVRRRRRRSVALAPRRRRRRRAYGGSVRRRRRNPSRVVYMARRGRGRRVRRRRNPSGMRGIFKTAFVPYIVGVATAGAAAMLDTGLARWPVARQIAKVGGVVAIAAFLGRKHPHAAAAAIGALGASQGYPLVTSLAGGFTARTPAEAVKGLAEANATNPEMGALLQGGIGALIEGPDSVDEVAADYATALHNMADDDDE